MFSLVVIHLNLEGFSSCINMITKWIRGSNKKNFRMVKLRIFRLKNNSNILKNYWSNLVEIQTIDFKFIQVLL